MDVTENAKKIISQAHQWTFEGDCSLLLLMQNISQNLEQRVQTTSEALHQLNNNVKRTSIALDNAANSLTALQYTQFVESRCHDDDETIANVTEVPVDIANANEEQNSSGEILKTFLKNNLEMLHNCHEKYSLDFDDSDDEDGSNNCIYQAKNPYNERLLPHIYGSKLWKENWHVGLCDSTNDYSGDEISEAFSESTSTSDDDNESYESNTANLSESASSTSMLNDKYFSSIETQNAASLRGSQPLFPNDERREPIKRRLQTVKQQQQRHITAVGSDTSSTSTTTSRTSAPSNNQCTTEHDLFATLHDTPPTTTTISTSASSSTSLQQHIPTHIMPNVLAKHSHNSNASSASKNSDSLHKSDLFAEEQQHQPKADFISTKPSTSQTKRKPVNIFNDDDFNSFLTEIVDKAQTKTESQNQTHTSNRIADNTTVSKTEAISVATNRAADNSKEATMAQKPTKPIAIEQPSKETTKSKQPLNLFDSPEGSPTNDSIFTSAKTSINRDEPTTIITKTKISAKSLFDDDDEDDDFLNVFGTKKLNLPQTSGKTLLFDDYDDDDDNDGIIVITKETQKIQNEEVVENTTKSSVLKTSDKSSLFDDNDDFAISTQKPQTSDSLNDNVLDEKEEENTKYISSLKTNRSTLVFDDIKDDFDIESQEPNLVEKLTQNIQEEDDIINKVSVLETNEKSLLFSDDKVEEFKRETKEKIRYDLFDTNNEEPKTDSKTIKERVNVAITSDESLPQNTMIVTAEREKPENTEILQTKESSKTTADIVKNNENISNININKLFSKPVNLFSDDVDEDDLFNIPVTKKSLAKTDDSKKYEKNKTSISEKTADETDVKQDVTQIDDINRKIVVQEKVNAQKMEKNNEDNTGDEQKEKAIVKKIDVITDESFVDDASNQSDKQKLTVVIENATKPITDTELETQQKLSPHTNNYAGIFLDEPPDDDDFFQTLGGSTLSTSKLTLDLEHDFYEPALPKPPTTTQKENVKIETNSKNDYSGLHLFSDIPPDDDDDDGDFESRTNSTAVAGDVKRLHSVFYDDFNETLEAVKQSNANKISKHSLFSDEPPSDDDNFDIFSKMPKQTEDKPFKDEPDHQFLEKAAIISEPEINKDNTIEQNRSIKELKQKLIQNRKTDETAALNNEKEKASNVAKLQLPKININVQALLPGAAGGKFNFSKSREEKQEATTSEENIVSIIEPVDTSTIKSKSTINTTAQSNTNNNENILPSICKNRVRAPAKRRPSTRRGREENYRKSLMEEQAQTNDIGELEVKEVAVARANNSISADVIHKDIGIDNEFANKTIDQIKKYPSQEDAKFEISRNPSNKPKANKENDIADDFLFKPNLTNIPSDQTTLKTSDASTNINFEPPEDTLFTEGISEQTVEDKLFHSSFSETKQPTIKTAITKITATNATKLFGDSDEDTNNDDLFKSKKINRNLLSVATETVPQPINPSASNESSVKVFNETKQHESKKSTLFFDEQSDSDDDIFGKSIKVAPLKTAKHAQSSAGKPLKTNKVNTNSSNSLFGSDNEDNDDFLKALKKSDTKLQAKSSTKEAKSLFSDVESGDDDDLFGSAKPLKSVATTSKASKSPKVPSKTSQVKAVVSSTANVPTAATKTLADNPLADLLDS